MHSGHQHDLGEQHHHGRKAYPQARANPLQ
jgi:hypothetical protein